MKSIWRPVLGEGLSGLTRTVLTALMSAMLLTVSPDTGRAAEADPLVRAREYIADENYLAASELLTPITRKEDAPLEAWLLLGAAFEGQGLPRRAITAYEEVMRLDKHNLDGGLGLGRNLVKNRDKRPRAVALYKSLLKVYPNEPRLLYGLGMAYNMMAEVSYAFDQYKLLQHADPELAQQLYDAIFVR